MPEFCCDGGTREGVKICTLHDQPLIGRAEAEAKGFTVFGNAELFCQVTGSAIGSFGVVDGLFDEIAEGEAL